ncbi:hypothetical protein RQN30_11930 [Arcanobacterium hippocoleae]
MESGKNWAAALAIETIFFFAVPIFFMLTGATLLRYRDRYDTQTFSGSACCGLRCRFLLGV